MTTAAERQSGSAAALQEDARQTYRQSLAAEMPLSGKALGSMFDRGERWGRDRIAEVRGETDTADMPVSGTDSGNALVMASTGLELETRVAEVHERRQSGSAAATPAVRRTTTAAVVLVALVAAVVSYEHMRHLAEGAGEGWRAWLLPLAVDGLMVAASMSMLVRKRQGQRAGALAWWALLLGIAASLAANVAAAEQTWTGRLVAAWPPVALLMAYELLMQQVKTAHTEDGANR